jgi:tRNA A37 threonylcarbamoyladenosine dehydratase
MYDESNQNRQIGSEALGESKVKALIKKYSGISGHEQKITSEWVDTFDFETYDFVVDAIDDVVPKCALIAKCYKKIISSMGSAKRIDSTKVEITKLSKTFNDPLARKVREGLKKIGFTKDVNVVFSPELPLVTPKGSFIGVTGAFGLACASLIIQKTLANLNIQ